MARADEEAIETFMSITGASEPVAIQKLAEHAGNLNEAIDAHFAEGDRNIINGASVVPQENLMDIDDPIQVESHRPPFPLFPSAGFLNPFSLLETELRRVPNLVNRAPIISHPRQVREIPIEVTGGIEQSSRSGHAPVIQDVTGTAHDHVPEINGTVIIDEEDAEDIPTGPTARVAPGDSGGGYVNISDSRPSAPGIFNIPDYNSDIEEEMIRAAIEASKNDSVNDPMPQQRQSLIEDPQLAEAVSLSLKDDEYLASLQGDREKELMARAEAETRRLEELEARKAALDEERQKKEELHKKLEEQQEMERQLDAKEASLPPEPSPNESDVVSLLVRMPDGSRKGRRFLKSHKLQHLFDFIDVGRVVKPCSYRLVSPYPTCVFSNSESAATFDEVGLSSRQEALFLEPI